MYGFGSGLVPNSPVCVNPLNEPELLRLGVSPEDIKRAGFAYILLITAVKNGVGNHVVFKSRSPSVAWRGLDEHFSPKTSGSMFDILTEFNNQRYNRGEDSDEYWIKLEKIQTRVRSSRNCPRHGGNQVSGISPARVYPCER